MIYLVLAFKSYWEFVLLKGWRLKSVTWHEVTSYVKIRKRSQQTNKQNHRTADHKALFKMNWIQSSELDPLLPYRTWTHTTSRFSLHSYPRADDNIACPSIRLTQSSVSRAALQFPLASVELFCHRRWIEDALLSLARWALGRSTVCRSACLSSAKKDENVFLLCLKTPTSGVTGWKLSVHLVDSVEVLGPWRL